MASVLLHCPLNISRSLERMVEDFCLKLGERHGIDIQIETQAHRPSEESLFKTHLAEDDLPDLTIGHANDFADLPAGYLSERFRSLPGRYPIRTELSKIGFVDRAGYFHPFVVIPFAIFYNPNLLGESDIPHLWKDLLDRRWHGKILMPDTFRVVSVVIKAFMKADFPIKFNEFHANVIHAGTPMDVVTAVDEGRYPIGITNIAFARITHQKNIRILWPEDGLYCMPQVMVWSLKAPEPLLEVGDFLLSRPVQEYLSLQSFVPASADAPLHQLVAENECNLRWNGWQSYLAALEGRHA